MAKFNFRILLETLEGHQTSYESGHFSPNTASAYFVFQQSASNDASITLISLSGSKTVTYTALSSSVNGSLSGSYVLFSTGSDNTSVSRNFVAAVTSSNGHFNLIEASTAAGGVVYLSQSLAGVNGNTTITTTNNFSSSMTTSPPPDTFTGGRDFTGSAFIHSFVDTDVDLVLSASQVWNRITGSVSCSYHNAFVGTSSIETYDGWNPPTFKDNLYLSSSLTGSNDLGTIEFKLKETEYDRLKRYKFFGSKVCNVLGLPENLWIYPDEFRLTDESQQNYFEGDVKAETLTINNSFNVSNVGNVTSDFPFQITKDSDRYIRFIENVSGSIPFNAVLLGYDVDEDVYELTSDTEATFNISGVSTGNFTSVDVGSGDFDSISVGDGVTKTDIDTYGDIKIGENRWLMIKSGSDDNDAIRAASIHFTDGRIDFRAGSDHNNDINLTLANNKVGILEDDPQYELDVAGTIRATGDIIAQNYIVSSSVTNISIATLSGSTQFGDTLDDIHRFTGSYIAMSSSKGDMLTVQGDISASGDFYLENSKYLYWKNSDSATVAVMGIGAQNNLAIGNSSYETWISGDGATLILSESRVGVGTYEPSKTLTVEGDISASGVLNINDTSAQVAIGDNVAGILDGIAVNGDISASGALYSGRWGINGGASAFILQDNYNTKAPLYIEDDTPTNTLVMTDDGNVGIRTGGVSPTKTLTVEGDISASGDLFVGVGDTYSISSSAGFETIINNNNESVNAFRLQAANTTYFRLDGDSQNIGIGEIAEGTPIPKALTVKGDISASGNIYLEDNSYYYGDATHTIMGVTSGVTYVGNSALPTYIFNNITASGNLTVAGDISASGDIYVGDTVQASAHSYFGQSSAANNIKSGSAITLWGSSEASSSINLRSGNQHWEITHNKNLPGFTPQGGILFRYNGVDKHAFDTNGQLGIGNVAPTKALTVEGDISASGDIFIEDGSSIAFNHTDASVHNRQFITSNTAAAHTLVISGSGGGFYFDTKNKTMGVGATPAINNGLTVAGDISASRFIFLQETGSAFQGVDGDGAGYLFASSSGQLCYQSGSTVASVIALGAGGGGGGSGTVTSVVAGAGLNGGTITSTGTISVDSASMGGFYSGSMNSFTTAGDISASGNLYLGFPPGTITSTEAGIITASRGLFTKNSIYTDTPILIVSASSYGSGGTPTSDTYALQVFGPNAVGTPGGTTQGYGIYTKAGDTNAGAPDTVALFAQGHEDGAPNSYAAIFSGSVGGVVGINTMEPTKELTVQGDISASGDLYVDNTFLGEATGYNSVMTLQHTGVAGALTEWALQQSGTGQTSINAAADQNILFAQNTTNRMVIQASTGNVQIGASTAPPEKLTVAGNISASGGYYGSRTLPTGSISAEGDHSGADIVYFGQTSGLVAGKMYYLHTDGTWADSNASDNTKGADELLGIALGSDATTNGVLLSGLVKMHSDSIITNVGRALYMSDGDNEISETAPSGNNEIVRIVGYVINANDTIYFNPDSTWIKITT